MILAHSSGGSVGTWNLSYIIVSLSNDVPPKKIASPFPSQSYSSSWLSLFVKSYDFVFCTMRYFVLCFYSHTTPNFTKSTQILSTLPPEKYPQTTRPKGWRYLKWWPKIGRLPRNSKSINITLNSEANILIHPWIWRLYWFNCIRV